MKSVLRRPSRCPQTFTDGCGIVLAPGRGVPLRVMTYNIQGQAAWLRSDHIERIGRLIAEVQPDVAGLQEVHRGGWQARGRDQAAEIERLTGLQLSFGAALSDARHSFGNALLTSGTIRGSRLHALPGKGEPRAMLAGAIELRGLVLNACVTHLAAWGPLGARTRRRQAEEIGRLVEALEGPVILTGDFNAEPTRPELAPLHQGPLMLSCFRSREVTFARTRQCLDSILVDRGWRVTYAEVLREGPSDHWPMIAELERAEPVAESETR